jgi:hypothetical protein
LLTPRFALRRRRRFSSSGLDSVQHGVEQAREVLALPEGGLRDLVDQFDAQQQVALGLVDAQSLLGKRRDGDLLGVLGFAEVLPGPGPIGAWWVSGQRLDRKPFISVVRPLSRSSLPTVRATVARVGSA